MAFNIPAGKDYLLFSGIRQCIIKKESGEHLLLLRTEVLSGNKVKNQVKA